MCKPFWKNNQAVNIDSESEIEKSRKMKQLHIITPVKDSIELTLQTIESILSSDFTVPYHYYVYNDFSTDENLSLIHI